MKWILSTAVFFATIAAPCHAEQWKKVSGKNIVNNPGFEQLTDHTPAAWNAPDPVYASDSTTARSGDRSLKFVNNDPDNYVLCSQDIDLKTDRRYQVKVWVRTRNVKGDDSGATVCIEWWDENDEYIGGCYPHGAKGDTTEWTEIQATTRRIPDNADHCNVTCYVREGMTGTAWFDDVSVRRVRQRPLKNTILTWPSYRGWITHDGPSHVQLRVRFQFKDLPGGPDSGRLIARVTPKNSDKTIAKSQITHLTGDPVDIQLKLPPLSPGRYLAKIALIDKQSGKLLCQDTHRLKRRTGPQPKCYIDRYNRVILNGEPFFPLGMYWGGVTREHLKTYAKSQFNCLMPYGRPNQKQMDMIDEFGLKVIYSIKDFYYGTKWCPDFIRSKEDEERAVRQTVRKYRDHPALLAWYLNDERPLSMLPRLQAHRDWLRQEDPNHPGWTVLYQVGQVAEYLKSFDTIGTDPYPIPNEPVSMAGNHTRRTRTAVADARSIWMVPQVFNWGNYRDDPEDETRPPTYDEMRSMTWQCVCEGADGLIFYSWMDLHRDDTASFEERWPKVKRLAAEVAEYIPVLLSVQATPRPEVNGDASIHWTVRKHDGIVYLFAVNNSRSTAEATITFPAALKKASVNSTLFPITDDAGLHISLKPLALNVYRLHF